MDNIQGEVVGVLNNLLYYCDWIMLSDNGLVPSELTNYTNLRTSMRNTITNILNYTDLQLQGVITSMMNANSDMSNRAVSFTANMTNLQTTLNAL